MASPPEPLATPPADVPTRRRRFGPWTLPQDHAGPSLAAAIWAISAVVWAYQVHDTWGTPRLGLDLRPVHDSGIALAHGQPLYSVPSFVYPPSAALLLGRPLSLLPFLSERRVAAVAVAAVMIATCAIGARAVGAPWFGTTAALGSLAVSLAQYVRQLVFLENVSAVIALGAACMILAWVRGRDVLAGALLGLTLAIKPMLAILLLCLLLLRRWRALAAALAVPIVLNVAVLPFDPSAFRGIGPKISDLLAGHGAAFDDQNGALVSIGRIIGWPSELTASLRLALAAITVAAALLLWRRRPEPFRSLEAAGVLLAGLFVVSTLYEDHFFFVLVPFAFACAERRSPLRWWPTAFFAALAADIVNIPARSTGLSFDDVLSPQRGLALAAVVVCLAIYATRLPSPSTGAPPSPVTSGSKRLTKTIRSSIIDGRPPGPAQPVGVGATGPNEESDG